MAGRKKGSKNLVKKGKKLVNKYDVEFTEKEKKKLESLVNSANRKRKKMLKDEANLPRIVGGKSTGKTLGETTGIMGKESDFILAPKTKSLQRFRTKKEYQKYVKNLKKVVDRGYIEKRVELYKKNHIKALKNVFGASAKDVVKHIKGMSNKDYMRFVQTDETMEIGYLASDQDEQFRTMMTGLSGQELLNRVKGSLGLVNKVEGIDGFDKIFAKELSPRKRRRK